VTAAKIKSGQPKRDPVCYRVERDIVIPAGTILRRAADQRGGSGYVECPVGHGPDFTSNFVVQVHPDAVASGDFRKVIAP
jgi:hypothetical protein